MRIVIVVVSWAKLFTGKATMWRRGVIIIQVRMLTMRTLMPVIVWVLVLDVRVLVLAVWTLLFVIGGVGLRIGIRKGIARRLSRRTRQCQPPIMARAGLAKRTSRTSRTGGESPVDSLRGQVGPGPL